ncbi:MAG: hypothetical protein ACRD0K_05265 [Egibacteraceae bacterium]
MELAVTVTAGGCVTELGTAPLDAALVADLGHRLGGTGLLGYGVMLMVDGDGSEDLGRDLLDFGLEDEFEAAAQELGLPVWHGADHRTVITGPAEPQDPSPWTCTRIVLLAEGPAGGHRLDIGRVVWLADRLGGEALLSYGVRSSADRDLRLDGFILDDAWCDELCASFSRAVDDSGLLAWPIERISIKPAREHPAGWAEERRYRPWPPLTQSAR